MTKIGELDLLPISGWEAPPTYFVSAGGLGYLALSWLMFYISEYLPEGKGMEDFHSAHFLAIDTTLPTEIYDLPEKDWARDKLYKMEGDLNAIMDEVNKGFYPAIKNFYEDTPIAKTARQDIGGNLEHGAGTTRPFGRIGFLYDWDNFHKELLMFIERPFKNTGLRFGKTFNVIHGTSRQFYVVTSLAGGTGSSCFLDIAATLHKIRKDQYPNEKWTIVGIFTLADVLASDKKVSVELHRKKMRANTYAALKELNHFLSGQNFQVRYGRNGENLVSVSNTHDQDKLFDLVFLVDTPNQNNEPLSGRKEVAQFLAQVMLQIGVTTLNKELSNRLVDTVGNLVFRQMFPLDQGIDDGKERQQFLFSSVGLCTLELPVKYFIEYSCYRIAEELLSKLWKKDLPDLDENLVERIVGDIGLGVSQIESSFNSCMQQVVLDTETELSSVRSAANPMNRIRDLAQSLESFPTEQVRQEARRTRHARLNHLFPAGGGLVRQEVDHLVQKGFLPHVPVIISQIIENLERYRTRLQREFDNAISQQEAGEVPASFNESSQSGILQSQLLSDVLNIMEQSWNTWQSRFLRGFYRNRFFLQFEGEIAGVLESFLRYQETANRLLIWPEKIGFIDEVIQQLQGMKDYYTRQQTHLQRVKSEIFIKKNAVQKQADIGTRYKLLAIDAETYFRKIFMGRLSSENEFLDNLANKLRDQGLKLESANRITLEAWEKEPPSRIVESLYTYCKTELVGEQLDQEDDLSKAHPCYQDGLDHQIFYPQDSPTSFSNVLSLWKHRSGLSLRFEGTLPETSRYIISGCRTSDDYNSWEKVLNLHALRMLAGGPPNQSTLITLGLGFPINSVARMKDWYEVYLQLKRDGWPIHLFNEEFLDVMIEPYLGWLQQPNKTEAEQLFEEAQAGRILLVSIAGNSNEEIVYIAEESLETLPSYIKNFFYEFTIEPKQFSFDELVDTFREKRDLLGTLKVIFLENIISDNLVSSDEWSTRQEKILNNSATDTDILEWCKEAGYLVETSGQYCFREDLCRFDVFSRDPFSMTFFNRREELRKITKEEFINGLQNRETLCRWITRKILRQLTDRAQRKKTIKRLSNQEFHNFLWETVSRHLDFRVG